MVVEKPEEISKEVKKLSGWVVAGGIISILWIIGCGVAIWNAEKSFWCLDLNEMGDFFAGAASGLAFLWLFVATMLQKQELQLQREVSIDQRDEFKKQSKIFEEQSAQMALQATFIKEQTNLLQLQTNFLKKQTDLMSAQSDIQKTALDLDFKNRKLAIASHKREWERFIDEHDKSRIVINAMESHKHGKHLSFIARNIDIKNLSVVAYGHGSDSATPLDLSRGKKGPDGHEFIMLGVMPDANCIYFLIQIGNILYSYGLIIKEYGGDFELERAHLLEYSEIPERVIIASGLNYIEPIRL